MSIVITCDSTCDLSPQQLQAHHIQLFPLYITKGDRAYLDGLEIVPADIFAHVAAGGELCSTAAVNLDDYAQRFRVLSRHPHLGQCQAFLLLSERLSGRLRVFQRLRGGLPESVHRARPRGSGGL